MPRSKHRTKVADWKEWLGEDQDFLREPVEAALRRILEAEREEALGAAKGRDGGALGVSQWVLHADFGYASGQAAAAGSAGSAGARRRHR